MLSPIRQDAARHPWPGVFRGGSPQRSETSRDQSRRENQSRNGKSGRERRGREHTSRTGKFNLTLALLQRIQFGAVGPWPESIEADAEPVRCCFAHTWWKPGTASGHQGSACQFHAVASNTPTSPLSAFAHSASSRHALDVSATARVSLQWHADRTVLHTQGRLPFKRYQVGKFP